MRRGLTSNAVHSLLGSPETASVKTGVLTPTASSVFNYKLRLHFTLLGKGDAALSRCIPLASGRHPEPHALGICVADEGQGGRGQCIVWPMHHQSGGAFLLPRHPQDLKGFRAPLDTLDQPFADWMPSTVRRLNPVRAVAP